ncbi:hypothetical protein Ancab_022870, partial [Ancistrocladus abbreviatus]
TDQATRDKSALRFARFAFLTALPRNINASIDVTIDGNVYGISVIEEGPFNAASLDPRHVLHRSDGASRLNLSPSPCAADVSSEFCRNCCSGEPGMLHHRAARAATGGRLTEHVNSARRNLESGGQPPPNSHACAHACLGERGISVVGIVVPKEHVAMNFESGAHACLDERGTSVVRIVEPKEHVAMNFESREQLSTNSLEFCSHVNDGPKICK